MIEVKNEVMCEWMWEENTFSKEFLVQQFKLGQLSRNRVKILSRQFSLHFLSKYQRYWTNNTATQKEIMS